MELDTEVKLMPPAAIEAFMVQLGGAIPSIPLLLSTFQSGLPST